MISGATDQAMCRALARNMADVAIVVFDDQLNVTLAEGACLASLGLSRETLEDRLLQDALPAQMVQRIIAHCLAALGGNSDSFDLEYNHLRFRIQSIPVRQVDEVVSAGILLLHNVSAKRFTEEARHQGEELYQMMTDLISFFAYAFRLDEDGSKTLEWVTEAAFKRLTGFDMSHFDDYIALGMYHSSDQEPLRRDYEQMVRGWPTRGEYRLTTRMGTVRWLQIDHYPVWHPVQRRVVRFYGVAQDITERKRMEEALRASEERYRIITELISDYAYAYSVLPDGSTVREWMTEDAFKRMTGFSQQELDQLDPQGLYHPDDHAAIQAFTQALLRGETCQGEYRIITKAGAVRWVYFYQRPVWDPHEKRVVRFYGVIQDITERRQAERRSLELNLERERIRMLTEFITAISHDFRTPLSVINTSAHLLANASSPEQQSRHTNKLHEQTAHIEKLVEGIVTMSKLDSPHVIEWEAVNLNDLVNYIHTRKQGIYEEKALNVTMSLDQTLPPMRGDREWIYIALLKIIENAIHYTPVGGLVDIHTRWHNEHVIFEVRDDGIGISGEQQRRIFDPLYRAEEHRPMGGQGLGLTIASKVVERHGGRIEVESDLGKGSLFRIILPKDAKS